MVMMACEAAGTLDLGAFYALPAWMQELWLGHAWNRMNHRYEPEPKRRDAGAGQDTDITPAQQAEIDRFHARRREAG